MALVVVGLEQLQQNLRDLVRRVGLQDFYEHFGSEVLPDVIDQFFDTRFFGQLPLTDSPNIDLIDTGQFRDSLTQRGHPGNVFIANDYEMIYGTRDSYFESLRGVNYPQILDDKYNWTELIAQSPLLRSQLELALEAWANDLIEDIF